MTLIGRLRTVHLALIAGGLVLTGMIALGVKIMLMRNFTPEATFDANGTIVVDGPYSYDNNLLDAITTVTWIAAFALVVVAVVWRHLRPMK